MGAYATLGLRLCLIASLAVLACEDTGPDVERIYNNPPRVWLAAGPSEGSTVDNPVHFYWGGWDVDGAIHGFQYRAAQNPTGKFNPADTLGVPWEPVRGNDSTFTFEPDSLNTPRSFTFFIRAIDDQGTPSRDAPHRTFSITAP
jgi:hypothetical protein